MLRASSWLLDPPFFTVKVLRRLTGILDEPGILDNYGEDVLGGLSNVGIMLQISGCASMLRFKKWDSWSAPAPKSCNWPRRLSRITCRYGARARRGSLVLSFLDSLFPGNIARIARLALLEWGIYDIKFKRTKFDCRTAAVAFVGSGVGWHSKRNGAF
jgi:hypothetical protein